MEAKQLEATIKSSEGLADVFKFIEAWDFGEPLRVKIFGAGSTLDYKAVFWIWMRALAKSFSERGAEDYKPEQIHDIVCHKFLGYTKKRTIGRTVLEPALRTITHPENLNRGEFFNLLREIEIWASDNGASLPQGPSQYQEDKARGEA